MARVKVVVTKRYDDHHVDDRIEVEESDLPRLTRRGRVRRLDNRRVDRTKLGGIPPDIVRNTSSTPKLVFVDGENESATSDDVPTETFHPEKAETPPETPVVGPPSNLEEHAPASAPVGPELRRPVRPAEAKSVVIKQVNQFWYHVEVDGKTVRNAKNKPRNFRKSEAEAYAERLRKGEEV